ncbi:hypothetical protein ACJX0J_009985 [Zea mays]
MSTNTNINFSTKFVNLKQDERHPDRNGGDGFFYTMPVLMLCSYMFFGGKILITTQECVANICGSLIQIRGTGILLRRKNVSPLVSIQHVLVVWIQGICF